MHGGLAKGGVHRTHSMSEWSLIGHWHCGRKHIQGENHEGIVLFGVRLLILLAFINVKYLDMGWGNSVLASACTALLWQWVLKLFMLFVFVA